MCARLIKYESDKVDNFITFLHIQLYCLVKLASVSHDILKPFYL